MNEIMSVAPVLFEERPSTNQKVIAIATLNAEKSLNALNLEMIELLYAQISLWLNDNKVAAIILQGAGERAFCAGGDVVSVYHDLTTRRKNKHSVLSEQEVKESLAYRFFTQEYQLDQLIHHAKKPIVVLANGYVMGGGIGLLAGASHRIATEKTVMAMPELAIGLYPDVGASFFLNQMPNGIGLFLGLTGSHFTGACGKKIGLIDHLVNHRSLDNLVENICQIYWQENEHSNARLLDELFIEEKNALTLNNPSQIEQQTDIIAQLTRFNNITEIYQAIVNLETSDKWLLQAQNKLVSGSPLSAHLIYKQLKRCEGLTLEESFATELLLSLKCSQHFEFCEGVRALLVDKDKQPQWQFKQIDQVEQTQVSWFFN